MLKALKEPQLEEKNVAPFSAPKRLAARHGIKQRTASTHSALNSRRLSAAPRRYSQAKPLRLSIEPCSRFEYIGMRVSWFDKHSHGFVLSMRPDGLSYFFFLFLCPLHRLSHEPNLCFETLLCGATRSYKRADGIVRHDS